MTDVTIKKIIANNAIQQLPDVFKDISVTGKILLIADDRTYQVAGELVKRTMASAGFILTEAIIYRNEPLVPDERALGEILLKLEPDVEVLLAVGSGSIIDLTRYLSFKLGKPFVAVATAPSMDGFASPVAALTIHGFKQTLSATIPSAIVADLEILIHAPARMILAGLGDLLGKYTALADWKLGSFINGESYSEDIADTVRATVNQTVENFKKQIIDYRLIKDLTDALITSGEAMLQWGNSRPASGAEHHLAHFWEMQALLAGQKSHLHGTKVGIAVILVADLYHKLFQLELSEVIQLISNRKVEPEKDCIERVNKVFGPLAVDILADLKGLYLDPEKRNVRQQAIIKQWELMKNWVQKNVPTAEEIRNLMIQAGAPIAVNDIDVNKGMLQLALNNAKEVRGRYTVFRLIEDIGWSLDTILL